MNRLTNPRIVADPVVLRRIRIRNTVIIVVTVLATVGVLWWHFYR